jgi:hypothetical protein
MSEPTSEQWERIEEMVERGSIGWHPARRPSKDLRDVLDYVDELQSRLSELDALAGLTPEQVAAIPQVLGLASELVAMVEIMDEYQPGTDLFTVGEVLKLAMAGAKS